jgi:hypothetical protein
VAASTRRFRLRNHINGKFSLTLRVPKKAAEALLAAGGRRSCCTVLPPGTLLNNSEARSNL